jgi:acyl homoserine lactone synthase
MEGFGIEHFVGVFDARMVRIYSMIGSSPDVLGSQGTGRDQISVGLWHFAAEAKDKVAAKAGLSPEISKLWFDRAFGQKQRLELAKAG